MKKVTLTADVIEAFSGMFLSPRYDSPQRTPDLHRECWAMYCSAEPACAIAAPRNHAKSTALTHDFILASVCFRADDYVILVGATEEMAIEHLGDIANEFKENEELISAFSIKGFITAAKTDIIIECNDGHQFRIIARGAEQKIRGRKWKGKRPGLIVGDDLEDDEQVESRDRRTKFRRWFFRACKQSLRDGGRIRVHGTILHEDSLLNRLMKNGEWQTRIYKAHAGFDDFSEILWPEKFPEFRLRKIRQEFIEEGDSAGYSQEYLNDPFDNEDAYLKSEQFQEMKDGDYDTFKVIGVGVDFAISTVDKANRTSFSVGGKDLDNILYFIDQRVNRWDSLDIVEEFFSINEAWKPEVFFVEDGVIWKSISPMLYMEMRRRDIWFTIEAILPTKDKKVRGRNWQKRMKARGCKFDKKADWYPGYEAECLRFTGNSEAVLDDQFDSSALLAKGFETWEVDKEDQMTEEEIDYEAQSRALRSGGGRSLVTGY